MKINETARRDYVRGFNHCKNVLRTLGMDAALIDANDLNVSRASWDYVRGYFEALSAARATVLA